jgi:hypothetical protein
MSENMRENVNENVSENARENQASRQLEPDMLRRHAEELVCVRVQPEQIDIFNKIVEAYDNLAIVSTVSAAEGTLACWVTADMRPILLKLLGKMPVKTEILELSEVLQNIE